MMYSCNFFSIYSLHLFSRTVWEGTLVTKLSGYHNYFGYHHLSGYHHHSDDPADEHPNYITHFDIVISNDY